MKLKVGGIAPRRSGTRHAAGNNEDNAIEKGYYSYLWLIVLPSFSLFPIPPIVLIFRGCFDNRRNAASRFRKWNFFFPNSISLGKKEKNEREEKWGKRKNRKKRSRLSKKKGKKEKGKYERKVRTRINWLALRGRGWDLEGVKVSEGLRKNAQATGMARNHSCFVHPTRKLVRGTPIR